MLFDHHCHGLVTENLNRIEFEGLISESSSKAAPGTSRFDSQIGYQILAHCAPLLGLDAFCSPDEYLRRREELGAARVNAIFLQAANIDVYGIETGHAAHRITTPAQMAAASGARVREIVRLERLAELVLLDTYERADVAAGAVLAEISTQLDAALRTAIGVKTIAAYRIGLDFAATRPSIAEVEDAVVQVLREKSKRLTDATIIRHLIWLAIDRGCVIQVHVGYGDDDVDLHRCNPLLMTEIFRMTLPTSARFALLHCYPYHREAGYLADVFPHVYFDVGLAINYTGSRSEAIIAESLEVSPFGKMLFSTDAFGVAEFYYLGVLLFERGLSEALRRFAELDGWPRSQQRRVADMIRFHNAVRLYGIDEHGSEEILAAEAR